jgi:hypothetical protein
MFNSFIRCAVNGVLHPQAITVSTQSVDLGIVHYMQPAHAYITVANNGNSLSYVRLTRKLEDSSYSPSWLKVHTIDDAIGCVARQPLKQHIYIYQMDSTTE